MTRLRYSVGEMMARLVVANAKGGSCKTTTAVSLAAAWAARGRRVLMVDLDPQASATAWLGGSGDGEELFQVLTERRPLADVVMPGPVAGLELVGSGAWLGRAERLLATEPGAERVLATVLDGLPDDRWDQIVLDCPPAVGLLTVSALAAANALLVPVETQAMALSGVKALMAAFNTVKERLNADLRILALVPSRVDRTRLAREVVTSLRDRFGDLVSQTVIRQSVRLAEAPSHHQPITEYAAGSHAAEDFLALALELEPKLAPYAHAVT